MVGRVDEVRSRMERELALAEAEDRLVELKEQGTAEEIRDHKYALREMRRAHREERSGSAAAQPDAVVAAAAVEEVQ